MGGQLDGNFLPGSVSHKFFSIVTLIICFVVNKFFSLLYCGPGAGRRHRSIAARPALSSSDVRMRAVARCQRM